jgi:hypothetical protein
MRKTIVESCDERQDDSLGKTWLDLERIASVEVTSEAPGYPIETVFAAQSGEGWRASEPSGQKIRLFFDRQTPLSRIQLRFHEADARRTQEFVLRWASATGGPWTEILRQQWNFSPDAPIEVEDYRVNLAAVSALELEIRPDLSGNHAVASLQSWKVARR